MLPRTLILSLVLAAITGAIAAITGKIRSPWLRDLVRGCVMCGLLAIAALAIVYARHMIAANPEINPQFPGAVRLAAIIVVLEAWCVSALVWVGRGLNVLERLNASMLIAVRQLRARKSGFLTVISFLAFLGVAVSTFALCFAISIMGGFGNDLKVKILGNNAHVVIDRERGGIVDWRPLVATAASVPGVVSATPLVQGEVMVTSQTNLSGVILRGIDPASGGTARNLRRELVRGDLAYLVHPERLLTLNAWQRRALSGRDAGDQSPQPAAPPPGYHDPDDDVPADMQPLFGRGPEDLLPGIVVGRELANNLHLAAGDEVRVVSPFGGMVTPAGPLPKTRLFRVAGVFYSGMYEYDTKYAYVTIPVAQNFFNYAGDQISSIEVRVGDVDQADEIAAAVRARLPHDPRAIGPRAPLEGLRVRDWKQLNQNLFRALRLEKLMMFVLLGVAIVVASFAIVATLLLLVIEKAREIAVLKAMGADDSFVARVFVYVGLIIGLVGSVMGVVGALIACRLIDRLGIPLDPEVYYIARLPVFISKSDYLFVMIIAVMVCLVATLYPAWAASRLRPVEGMRFG